MVEPHVRQKTFVLSLRQLDSRTPLYTLQTRIANLVTNMVSLLRQNDAITAIE